MTAAASRHAPLLIDGGAPGVWGFSGEFERVVGGLDRALGDLDPDPRAESAYFPPVLSRSVLERSGYLDSFPHLLGSVHALHSSEEEWRADRLGDRSAASVWRDRSVPTDVVLLPAACYPIYPLLSGELPPGGRSFVAHASCFRHEASSEAGRLKAFRIKEFVRADSAEQCVAWRDEWIERGVAFLRGLGLDVQAEPASDPFFGRGHRLMKATQVHEGLKIELRVPIDDDATAAVASMNCHRDHFSSHFDITERSGAVAHTACVGFGLERLTLALVERHGADLTAWPPGVRRALCL